VSTGSKTSNVWAAGSVYSFVTVHVSLLLLLPLPVPAALYAGCVSAEFPPSFVRNDLPNRGKVPLCLKSGLILPS
jgi:hypothetical protein